MLYQKVCTYVNSNHVDIFRNTSLEEDDGVWIISESVSSSVSNAQGQVISVQPVFPQNTIPQIVQGKTLGKSRD